MSVRPPIDPAELQRQVLVVSPYLRRFDKETIHVAVTNADAYILYANTVAAERTGYLDSKEVLGKNPGDLWGGRMDSQFFARMWKTIKDDKQRFVGNVKNVRKDGAEYWVSLQIQPVLDDKNMVKYYVALEPNVDTKPDYLKRVYDLIEEFRNDVKDLK